MAIYMVGISQKKFTYFIPRTHSQLEIILNLEGSGTATIGGRSYTFRPGTICIVPPGIPHRKESDDIFKEIYVRADSLPMGSSLFREETHVVEDDADHTAEKLMQMLLSRFLVSQPDDKILNSLFSTLCSYLEEWSKNLTQDPVVKDLIARFRSGFSDPEFSVTKALIDTGYNKDYIRRRFCSCIGMNPNHYLTDLRIRYAKQLLAQEHLQLTIGDVAGLSGFYDYHYFTRVFQKHTGMTPSEFMATANDPSTPEKGRPL